MASGDTLGTIIAQQVSLPTTLFAQPDTRTGAATPAESVAVLDFDTTTQEYADFLFFLPRNYASGGLTLTLIWMATTATSGAVVWAAAFRRLVDDAEDLDTTAHAYDFNKIDAGATTASATGEQVYDPITFTDGADMDSLAAGEWAILRVSRDTSDADDNMAGDAELIGIEIKET